MKCRGPRITRGQGCSAWSFISPQFPRERLSTHGCCHITATFLQTSWPCSRCLPSPNPAAPPASRGSCRLVKTPCQHTHSFPESSCWPAPFVVKTPAHHKEDGATLSHHSQDLLRKKTVMRGLYPSGLSAGSAEKAMVQGQASYQRGGK